MFNGLHECTAHERRSDLIVPKFSPAEVFKLIKSIRRRSSQAFRQCTITCTSMKERMKQAFGPSGFASQAERPCLSLS
ncbi:hypothetical protein PO124_10085 [Bacillus licheniformis]|nr:hypothetical protein [Bacillus licheniformis]